MWLSLLRLSRERRCAQAVRVTRDREWRTPEIRRRARRRGGCRSREEIHPRREDESRMNQVWSRNDCLGHRARRQLEARTPGRSPVGLWPSGGSWRAAAVVGCRRVGLAALLRLRLKRLAMAARMLKRQRGREQNSQYQPWPAQTRHRISGLHQLLSHEFASFTPSQPTLSMGDPAARSASIDSDMTSRPTSSDCPSVRLDTGLGRS